MNITDREISDEFVSRGRWWLPGLENDQAYGTLSFSPQRIDLELDRMFTGVTSEQLSGAELYKPPIVFGETTDGTRYTLIGSLATSISLTAVRFTANSLVAGAHISSNAENAIKRVLVNFTHLESWCGLHLVEESVGSDADSFNLVVPTRYRSVIGPQQIPGLGELDLSVGVQIHRENGVTFLRDRSQFSITFDTTNNLACLDRTVRQIGKLLSLLVGEPVFPRKIRFTIAEGNPERSCAEYFITLGIKPSPNDRIAQFEMNLPLSELGSSIAETLFERWFAEEERLGVVYDLLSGTIYNTRQNPHAVFLTLAQAFETFHRRLYAGTYVSSKEYEQIREAVAGAIPSETRDVLRGKLRGALAYGNELSLRDRLRELLNGLAPESRQLLWDDADVGDFVKSTASVRNYLTHYEEAGKPAIVSDLRKMHNLNQRLRAILSLLLLKYLGVDESRLALPLKSHLNLAQ